MNRSVVRTLLVAAVAALVWPTLLAAQGPTSGLLLSPHVACRAAPALTAEVVWTIEQTGDYRDAVSVEDSAVGVDGATWLYVRRTPLMQESCWVPERLVGPDRDPASLLAMAGRLLAAPEGRSPGEWVSVHNLFGLRPYREDVEASPLLKLRRLEVLRGALIAAQSTSEWRSDPRTEAWIESLGGDVEAIEDWRGEHRWVVRRAAFDALYEAHREDPLAEEILWKGVRNHPLRTDCQRNLTCVFDGPLPDLARYWLAYPDGRFVDEAVWTAMGWLRASGYGSGILRTCERLRVSDPGSMYRLHWRWWDELEWRAEGRPAAQRLLGTLSAVAQERKAPLVDYLDQVEVCAAAVETRPPPPEEPPRTRAEAESQRASTPPPASRELAVIEPGVSCRFEPSRTSRSGARLYLNEHFTTERPDTVAAGEAWVAVRRWGNCWVPKEATASLAAYEHVLAIADRFLASSGGRTLDHSLRVYNVLGSRVRGHRDVVDASALLSLRRLQVLGEVLEMLDGFTAEPLLRGWAEQLTDDVRYFEPGGAWYVREEAFQRVYDAHRGTVEAEDVLWELATGPAPNDCEGSFSCWAGLVLAGPARYWVDYPRGRRVPQAIDMATSRLGWFPRGCEAAQGAEPDSPQAQAWEQVAWDPRDADAVRRLRATLADVPPSDAAPLITLLDRLQACASESEFGGTRNLIGTSGRDQIGLMTTVSVSALKADLWRYIRRVRRGGEVEILDRGALIARLVAAGSADEDAVRDRLVREGILRPGSRRAASILDHPPLSLPISFSKALAEDRVDRL